MDKTVIGQDDQPNPNMVAMARNLHENGGKVILMTMCTESQRQALYAWILKHMGRLFENVALYMPKDDDKRDEKEIVADWLRDIKAAKQTIATVIEGRDGMAQMWLDLGLPCLERKDGK